MLLLSEHLTRMVRRRGGDRLKGLDGTGMETCVGVLFEYFFGCEGRGEGAEQYGQSTTDGGLRKA